MTERLIRGDSPEWVITLTDTVTEGPLDLTGCRVTTTFRKKPDDPILYQHYIQFGDAGEVVEQSGMALDGEITDGRIIETLSAAESALFVPGKYGGDVEVRRGALVRTQIVEPAEVVRDYTLPPE